jgi:anti-anti-sigma regulatory factor
LAFYEVAAELGAAVTTEPAGLESSIENAEHVCQEVQDLLAKARSMIDHVCDISALESTSTTMAGVLEALSVKENGEDPLVVAVRHQVTTGSESIFSVLMMHGVECDFDKVTSSYPKDKDGCDISPKAFLECARELSARMASFLADRNARRAGAKTRKHSTMVAPSSRAAGSST